MAMLNNQRVSWYIHFRILKIPTDTAHLPVGTRGYCSPTLAPWAPEKLLA